MNIETAVSENETVVALEGRLDTTTASALETELEQLMPECSRLVLDFGQLEYISSAGLRVLLLTQKMMADREFIVRSVRESVMSILEMTGFADILTIE